MAQRAFTPRQTRKALRRIVDDRTVRMEAFIQTVKAEHHHRLRRRAAKCLICTALRALGEIE